MDEQLLARFKDFMPKEDDEIDLRTRTMMAVCVSG